MDNADVRVFANLKQASVAAADRLEGLATQAVAAMGIFSAALSGGSTPKLLYEELARPERSSQVPWAKIHLFQVDERDVPPDHPDSNYKMIREALLDRAPVSNFHRLAADWPDRAEACTRYEQELRQVLRPGLGDLPHLDLIILGIGADGHTASLFPGAKALHEETRWVTENYVEHLKRFRLTMTFPLLNAAKEIIILVSGSAKAEVLHDILEGSWRPERFPAQKIRPTSGHASWYVDKPAARLLETPQASPASQ